MFAEIDPEHFGVFDKAFITLFFVSGGDPWPETLPKTNEDGSANWVTAGYVMVYTVVVDWVIIEASRNGLHTARFPFPAPRQHSFDR